MAFKDVAALATDRDFAARLAAGLAKEGLAKAPDYLVDQILKNPSAGAAMFMPLVSAAPGFDDKYLTDGQLAISDNEMLSAIQANWQRVFDLYEPAS